LRDQVSKEAATSQTALQRALHGIERRLDEGSSLSQILDEPA
jgi:hypothetical protein